MIASTDPAVDVYPVQWEGVMDNGLLYFEENAGESHAKRLPRPLREIRVKSHGWAIPFVIEIPLGARPRIYQNATELRVMGAETNGVQTLPRTYIFGWEKEVGGKTIYSLWEFSFDRQPVHYDRPP